ncbi:15577_t:CDS:2, partial [Cetraspora pellucida]
MQKILNLNTFVVPVLDAENASYIRSYEPTWAAPKFEYIHKNVLEHNYNKINRSASPSVSVATSEEKSEDEQDEPSSNEESDLVLDYKLFVKLSDGTSLPAKWFKESVLSIDEFFSSIHDKVILLTNDTKIMPNNYRVTFQTQREAGVGTQLADTQDFLKFKAEYIKLSARKCDIGIYITFTQSSQNKRKKKELDSDEDEDVEKLSNHKKNRIPNVSSLSSYDKTIAENVLEIQNAYHCNIYNRPCLNKENYKDLHVEITFMMLLIWAADINKRLATIETLLTHPLFSYTNIFKKIRFSGLPVITSPQPQITPILLSSLSPQIQPQPQ